MPCMCQADSWQCGEQDVDTLSPRQSTVTNLEVYTEPARVVGDPPTPKVYQAVDYVSVVHTCAPPPSGSCRPLAQASRRGLRCLLHAGNKAR